MENPRPHRQWFSTKLLSKSSYFYMTTSQKITLASVITLLLAIGATLMIAFYSPPETAIGASWPPPANQRSATTTEVGPDETVAIFSANPNCVNRVVRTQGVLIDILFDDPTNGDLASTSLTAIAGFFQSASTTVSYPAEDYGCDVMYARAQSSTTITTGSF